MDELISKKQAMDTVFQNALHLDEMYEAIRKLPPVFQVITVDDEGILTAALKALKKQVPEVPDVYGDGYADGEPVYDTWDCPSCGASYEIEGEQHEYCPHCGQRINWEGYEEE